MLLLAILFIADKNEVWVMELIGKGNYEKGAVWVVFASLTDMFQVMQIKLE